MNSDLQGLIEIAKIDAEASLLEPEIIALENELNDILHAKYKLQDDIDATINRAKKAQVEISGLELSIQENKEKLDQIDKKVSAAKSERELRALDAENGLAKEKITFANEQITLLEKEIEDLKNKEQELLKDMENMEVEIQKTRESVEKRSDQIKVKLKKIFDSKEKLAKKIDHKIIVFYEKIRKWAKNTSVVPVRKQACGGCFIKINDRIFLELNKDENIATCPHCGRILYLESA